MVTNTCYVKRAGNQDEEINITDLVPGDIVMIAAGDMIPADMRIIEAKDLFVSQSSLTGESDPIEKRPEAKGNKHSKGNVIELENICFMGSNVVSGSATGIVFATGNSTYLGTIARSIAGHRAATAFDKGISKVSFLLIRFMLIMIPFVFLVNGVTKGDWLEAFIFAVSVAVGLTPEMLPMIVTANLAKGAVAMSKKKTIVKDLNAIQNFGAMNILCTDKTGTLTCDQIVLEKYINADGSNDESRRILRHAYFNSFFQTGLKNLMDKAILSHVKDLSLEYLKDNYTKVDEIPFDFTRRRMSVVVEDRQGKRQIITKGAVEEMLDICSHAEFDGEVHPMTIELKNKARDIIEQMNKQGMRVIAVAHKSYLDKTCDFRIEDEKDMVLIGYLAFLDPPKQSAASAIKQLHEHGIEIKILSGDNDAVVRTIARQVGIRTDNALTGPIFETMSEEEKMKAVNQTTVFSKLTPIQKTEIITLLQAQQHTVGFLGDGINDAAALRQSDIGIILSITSLNYQQHGSNYHVGFALHSGMYMDYEEGTPEKTEKERRKIIWGYAEQRLAPGLHALLQGSFQSGASRGCKSYAGAGLTWQCGKQKADCSPTMPDFPLHTNGPVNLHGKSPVQATDLYNPPYISFSKREHII